MLIKLKSISYIGIDCVDVDVEINISNKGMPCFDIVGLPNKEINESRQRIQTAITNCGILFPNKKITVNLAPADLPKKGSFYDLSIAAGIVSEVLSINLPNKALFFGELSLDGSLRFTKGSFALALFAKQNSYDYVFLPMFCAQEVSIIKGVNFIFLNNLNDLILFLKTGYIHKTVATETTRAHDAGNDMSNIAGQALAKRALEISAAGGHSLLMYGPPGSGKTLLAQTYQTIVPELGDEQLLEVAKIHSLTGVLNEDLFMSKHAPFRSPHHTISFSGLLGGGINPTAGEVTLAHRGILFLDELSEFSRNVLESLRQPVESGSIRIVRNQQSILFPCRFILLAATNLCPCGYYGHTSKKCVCSLAEIHRYMKKLSGPILDRIDLFININSINYAEYKNDLPQESSREIKKRVVRCRELQLQRYSNINISLNSELTNANLKNFCKISITASEMLEKASARYALSTRAITKTIKIARTIADLDSSRDIEQKHLSEALQFRNNPTIIS